VDAPDQTRGDTALIDRIFVARDPSAVGELYDRHNRLLYGLILRILRDRSEADEVLQDVFVLVWTRAETLQRGALSARGLAGCLVAASSSHRPR
jgi:DNA-directed RNA polymerase specialized sigma24 family protein